LELHIKAAEVGRTYGDYHETLALVKEILTHGRCLKDKLRALLIKAYVLGGQYKLLEAIDTCMGALKQLGIRLPSNPKTFHVLFEYAKTKRILKEEEAHDLLSLARMMRWKWAIPVPTRRRSSRRPPIWKLWRALYFSE
jgi:hypothetical protein